jgi:peptide/nickel transport system substrate-binding protein
MEGGSRRRLLSRPRATRWEAVIAAAVLAASVSALAVLAGCARRVPAAEDRPLEVLVSSDPETLDPRYVTDAVGMRVTRLVHAGLVRLDADTLEPRPYAAAGWRWVDDRTLEVSLRQGLRFHSGASLTAHDVVATIRAFASPTVASRHASVVEAIAEAVEQGEHTVVLRLSRPHATLLTDLEIPILRADQAGSPPAPGGSLDGLGPFAVARATPGEILLEPADGGALPRPAHAVLLRAVHDENARALRLLAGRADVAVNLVSPALLPPLETSGSLAVAGRPGANLTYAIVDEEHGPLTDARVRRALSMAIDRPMLCATLLGGRAQPAGDLVAPASWAHAGGRALPFDPAESRAELASAGAAGMHLTLLTSTERLRGDIVRVLAQELRDVGVDAEVVQLELGTMFARLNAGEFDLAVLQLPEMSEPNVLRYFLHGSFVPPAGANRGRVHDATLDALLDEGDRTPDTETRRAVYARVEAVEREAMHWLPLWYEDQVTVTSARARAFLPSAEGRWLGLARIP